MRFCNFSPFGDRHAQKYGARDEEGSRGIGVIAIPTGFFVIPMKKNIGIPQNDRWRLVKTASLRQGYMQAGVSGVEPE